MLKLVAILLFVHSLVGQLHAAVIYANDDRVDVHESKNSIAKKASLSVAAMISKRFLKLETLRKRDYILSNTKKLSDPSAKNICSNERFSKQVSVSKCSGFLIDEKRVLTAAHCMEKSLEGGLDTCREYYWVFDFSLPNSKKIKSKSVYSCHRFSVKSGFAIVELDRLAFGIAPLKINRAGIKRKDDVYSIGHPSGLPKKITNNGSVIKSKKRSSFFYTDLDLFEGSSGSPIFLKNSSEVVGMVSKGEIDYIYDNLNLCMRPNRCKKAKRSCLRKDFLALEEALKLTPFL